jgi:hypothetical protein
LPAGFDFSFMTFFDAALVFGFVVFAMVMSSEVAITFSW